ncbi:Uncharacterized protein APZ42_021898, partial [Daphnia magna]
NKIKNYISGKVSSSTISSETRGVQQVIHNLPNEIKKERKRKLTRVFSGAALADDRPISLCGGGYGMRLHTCHIIISIQPKRMILPISF